MTVALIGIGIIVFTKLFVKNEQQDSQTHLLRTMEETFAHFALDIEEENKEMIEQVKTVKEQFEQQNFKLLTRIEFLENQLLEKTLNKHKLQNRATSSPQIDFIADRQAHEAQEITAATSSEPEKNGMLIKQRYQQLFALYDAGKSIDYIAKKLAINKGEVQLIMQLGLQEEQGRV